MTTYAKDQFRKVLKIEQAAYIQAAIENAKTALPQHEGSRNPTGRTIFYVRTTHEGLERFAELKANGWILDTSATALFQEFKVPLSFTAIAPDHVFESYIPLIAERAEQDYLREVEAHNKQAQKLKERAEYVESEVKRLEEDRLAKLRADLAKKYDSNANPTYVNSEATQLHAR